MVGIRILNSTWQPIAIFEPWFDNSGLLSLSFSDLLDGIWTGRFEIPTWSEMRQYLQINNIVEIIDFSGCNGEQVIWRGWIRPNTKICDGKSVFFLNETKDILQSKVITSEWTVNNITEALDLIGLPYLLNSPDITLEGIEYRVWMTAYTLLEEIRKATWYNYSYDGFNILYGRLWEDRTDVWFSDTVKPWNCLQCEWEFYIDNICAQPTIQYDKVIAYNDDIFATAWSGWIEISVSSEADNMTDLQLVADEYLDRWKPWRIITFDARNIPAWVINVWDRIDVSISTKDDSRNVDDMMYVVKTEGLLDWCNVTTRVFISEEKILYKDDFNVINNLANRIQNLETK